MKTQLIEYLSKLLTPNRLNLLNRIIEYRTSYITVLLEDIYQSQNASAVLRTCDCFGIQNVHIVENEHLYTINPDVALGSSKWLYLNRYNEKKNNTIDAINHLKNKGYRIVATSPHTNDVPLDDFDITKGKVALLFGSEKPGLSEIALDNADEFLNIPMFGFTESFNISVSASIILHHLTYKLRNSDIDYLLDDTQKKELMLSWLKATIKKSDIIIDEFYKRYTSVLF